jgi:hypothetical protein
MLSPSAVKAPTQPPTDLTAKGSDGKVTLMWTPPPPVNAESYPTSYNLYWSLTAGVTKSSNRVLNVSMPFVHLDLTNGTAYYYKVAAANPAGEGPLSAEVWATPLLPFTKILTKLMDPDAEQWDEFGWSVAIDGDYAVVGAWRSGVVDQNAVFLQDAGAAYVFHRANGVWDPAGTRLTASDAQVDDHFGCAVAISGDYIIVGAMDEDGGTGDPLVDAGAVYIFQRTGANTWDAGTKLIGLDAAPAGRFGSAVAISGDIAVVGEEGMDRAYVLRRTGTNAWDNSGTQLWAPDTEAGDHYGCAVGVSGDYAIVGAYGEDGGPSNPRWNAGAAYIFHRTGVDAWYEYSKVMPHDSAEADQFGSSVAISGDYAAVGAYTKDNETGAAYVFHRQEVNYWDEGPKIVAPDAQEGDNFGTSVAITDKYLLIGAALEDCGWDENNGEGSAYLFERIGANTWDGGTKITIPAGDIGDNFGYAVALSGESAIIGAIGDDCNEVGEVSAAGAVYMY